ncbi:polysaccharide deacetylase family protein [soil metagenome]
MLANFKFISTVGKALFPSLLWNFNTDEKVIYLTFDDGPIPDITPKILAILKEFKARATFFCIGENIERNPEIFKLLQAGGHSIGNHTFNHLNGWKTSQYNYINNALQAEYAIAPFQSNNDLPKGRLGGKLFRPPYGKITPAQIKALEKLDYKIVMWDVISGDYDQTTDSRSCYLEVINNAREGSIIVFHDSLKAYGNLEKILPGILKYYSEKGFEFRAL